MRIPKPLVGVLAALVLYLAGTVLAAPMSAHLAGNIAYAAPIDDACAKTSNVELCKAGFQAQADGQNRDSACADSSGQDHEACVAGWNASAKVSAGEIGGDQPAKEVDSEKCASVQADWAFFTCPFFSRVANLFNDGVKSLLGTFLAVQPLDPNSTIYKVWDSIRTLANVSFVLVFLVIIFANALSINLDAYLVRKSLPRLVAAAILVQFSFMICSVLIDIGNILGAGIGGIIQVALHGGQNNLSDAAGIVENAITGVSAIGLAGLALIGWEFAFPLALIFLISVFAAVVVLAVRYFLLGVLVVVSPLAFAAFVLPGTEVYFVRWRQTFIRLILMYPIIMALLSLAANTNNLIPLDLSSGSTAGQVSQATVALVIQILVLTACFAAITQTFKWAGGFMEIAYNRVNGLRGKGVGKVKESERRKDAGNKLKSRRQGRMDKIDKWAENNKLIGGDRSGKLSSRFAKGTLMLAGGAASGTLSSGPLGREREKQAVIKGMMDTYKDLNLSRSDLQTLSSAESGRDITDPRLKPYHSTLGQAAALRYLNKEKAIEESGKVEVALAGMARSERGRRRAQEIRRLSLQGEGGIMYVADPALSRSGLGGVDLLKIEDAEKIRSGYLAGIMASTDSVSRNFGNLLVGDADVRTRQVGEKNAAGDMEKHHLEEELESHGLVGGYSLRLSPQALKDSLKGQKLGDSSASGRIAMREGLTDAAAQQRISILRNYALTVGDPDKAAEATRAADNLEELADIAADKIKD